MASEFSDEILMRFADGELDEATAAELEAAMEADDALVARVAMFIETRAQAKDAMAPMLDEPVPAALADSVAAMIARKRAAERVVPMPVRVSRPANSNWGYALAASLVAAVIGGGAGYWLAGGQPGSTGLVAGRVAAPIAEALETVASGDQRAVGADRFTAISSFRDAAQALCREFELDSGGGSTFVSVACREGEAWSVRFTVAASPATTGYAPASSLEALDAYLTAINAGAPMTTDDEKKALPKIAQQ